MALEEDSAVGVIEKNIAAEEIQTATGSMDKDDLPLPIIDLSMMHKIGSEREMFIKHLRNVLHHHGFFYLSGHGVAPDLIRETVYAAKTFFSLPLEAKLEIDIVRSPHFRGYTRAGGEITGGTQDWREQVDFDREEPLQTIEADTPRWKRTLGPNQWPAAMPALRATILRYQNEVTRVAIDVLKAIALALGQAEDFFEDLYAQGPRQHLKIIRYPGRDLAGSDQGVGAHKDGGLITILLQRERAGLRVQTHEGSWVEVPPCPVRSSSIPANCWNWRQTALSAPISMRR
nr:2-oxoglutarate and iron-dependent oxygenase domain-containing protein [Novosphingobium sp. 9]